MLFWSSLAPSSWQQSEGCSRWKSSLEKQAGVHNKHSLHMEWLSLASSCDLSHPTCRDNTAAQKLKVNSVHTQAHSLVKTECLTSSAAQPCLAAHCPQNLLLPKLPHNSPRRSNILFYLWIFTKVKASKVWKQLKEIWRLKVKVRSVMKAENKILAHIFYTFCMLMNFALHRPFKQSRTCALAFLHLGTENKYYLCNRCRTQPSNIISYPKSYSVRFLCAQGYSWLDVRHIQMYPAVT